MAIGRMNPGRVRPVVAVHLTLLTKSSRRLGDTATEGRADDMLDQ